VGNAAFRKTRRADGPGTFRSGDSQVKIRFWNRSALTALGLSIPGHAFAAAGHPEPWQMGFQDAVSPVAEFVHDFHTWLVWIITIITLFVLGLLIAVVVKFNEKANPVPSRTTHHTGLEIAWTIIPVLILVGIAIPSFRLLKYQIELPKADITVKAIGNQWYWSYEYPQDQGGGFKFDSYYGQCSRLCGQNHAYMPIAIRVVSQDKYAAWLADAKKKFASNDAGAAVQVASRSAPAE
jgi:cytochrome c oxidase subunit 2